MTYLLLFTKHTEKSQNNHINISSNKKIAENSVRIFFHSAFASASIPLGPIILLFLKSLGITLLGVVLSPNRYTVKVVHFILLSIVSDYLLIYLNVVETHYLHGSKVKTTT